MTQRRVTIPTDGVALEGELEIPEGAKGLVLFVHGSGSSRHSPRNQFVARALRGAGLATLLIDLLTAEEEREDVVTARLRFDIDLLARRVTGITAWLAGEPATRSLRFGYFGSSTGAAAALVAAAANPHLVGALVSRGGRPDLARRVLRDVAAPTLLIVGGHDVEVIWMNEAALSELRTDKRMELVPGATHLFEEPGALERVARLAGDWFRMYLTPSELHLPDGAPVRP